MSSYLNEFERLLRKGVEPTLTPEWGEELVKTMEMGNFHYPESLKVFIEKAPFTYGYWCHVKKIFKLLEKRLIEIAKAISLNDTASLLSLSLVGVESEEKIAYKDVILNLSVMFNRFEKFKNFSMKEFEPSNPWSFHQPRVKWGGDVKYSQEWIFIDDNKIKVKDIVNHLITHPSVRKAEVFGHPHPNEPKKVQLRAVIQLKNRTSITQAAFIDFLNLQMPYPVPEVIHFDYQNFWGNRRERGQLNFPHIPLRKKGDLSPVFSGPTRWLKKDPIHADLRPYLLETIPSTRTMDYIRRRCRRLLRTLQNEQPTLYVDLCFNYFNQLKRPQKVNLNSQWLLTEMIFGLDEAVTQRKHGRGNIKFPVNYHLNEDRKEPCQEAWNNHLPKIKKVLEAGKTYLIVLDFLAKVWENRKSDKDKLSLSSDRLNLYLQSASVPLIKLVLNSFSEDKIPTHVNPASLARALVMLKVEETESYIKDLFESGKQKLTQEWLEKFSYDFDDAIYSQQKDVFTEGANKKTINLVLLALRFPWAGRKKVEPENLEKGIFSWSSATHHSAWNNVNWRRPNTSLETEGLLGWPSSLSNRSLHSSPSLPKEIDVHNLLLQANKDRLLDLTSFKQMSWQCSCESHETSKESSVTIHVESSVLLGPLNKTIAVGDPRLKEACQSCGLQKAKTSPFLKEIQQEAPSWLKKEIFKVFCVLLKTSTDLSKSSRSWMKNFIKRELEDCDFNTLSFAISNLSTDIPYSFFIKPLMKIDHEAWEQISGDDQKGFASLINTESFISTLWDYMGNEKNDNSVKTLIYERFFQNPSIQATVFSLLAPEQFNQVSEHQANVFSLWLSSSQDKFSLNSELLFNACISPDERIHSRALEHAKNIGLDLNFSLALVESKFPTSIEEGEKFFRSLRAESKDLDLSILSLCDSSQESVQLLGLELLERHKKALNSSKLLLQLSENRHRALRKYVAEKANLVKDLLPDISEFDLAVLRSRHTGRKVKEMVKHRLKTDLAKTNHSDTQYQAALAELAVGLVNNDKEWAIQQLTELELKGRKVTDLKIHEIKEVKNANS
jgi:hypothetical protein